MPKHPIGVEVTLLAIDNNGNCIYIGKVTTDSSGMYKKPRIPTIAGEYTIVASFDES